MPVYELKSDSIVPVPTSTFGQRGIRERSDLQRILRSHLSVVSPETLVISEEFGQWEDSRRRIDLLGLDKAANLVVIELKRTEDGGHMQLQAIRYAAMISTMTFEQVVAARDAFQRKHEVECDASAAILEFLGWEEPDEDQFAQDVRIVLVSADFSKELTTSVMWLNTHDIDIRCVRLKPYVLDGRVLIDVQQVIPLPEAAEYQIQIREKIQKERKAKRAGPDFTRYDVVINGTRYSNLWKRRAMLLVAQALVQKGISPEEIAAQLNLRGRRLWWRVDGEVHSAEFIQRASEQAESLGRAFDAKRWLCADADLIRWQGSTYALSIQGGASWPAPMDCLSKAYPELEIQYAPAENGDPEAGGDDEA